MGDGGEAEDHKEAKAGMSEGAKSKERVARAWKAQHNHHMTTNLSLKRQAHAHMASDYRMAY